MDASPYVHILPGSNRDKKWSFFNFDLFSPDRRQCEAHCTFCRAFNTANMPFHMLTFQHERKTGQSINKHNANGRKKHNECQSVQRQCENKQEQHNNQYNRMLSSQWRATRKKCARDCVQLFGVRCVCVCVFCNLYVKIRAGQEWTGTAQPMPCNVRAIPRAVPMEATSHLVFWERAAIDSC